MFNFQIVFFFGQNIFAKSLKTDDHNKLLNGKKHGFILNCLLLSILL